MLVVLSSLVVNQLSCILYRKGRSENSILNLSLLLRCWFFHIQSGSVDLLLDVGGGHYASKHVTIPRGVYEGQLVVGDSFVHPVQKFEVENDGVVVLQFESSHHHDGML